LLKKLVTQFPLFAAVRFEMSSDSEADIQGDFSTQMAGIAVHTV
jgi:hypothetical protein